MGHLARGHVKSEVCTLRAVGGTKLESRERSGFRDEMLLEEGGPRGLEKPRGHSHWSKAGHDCWDSCDQDRERRRLGDGLPFPKDQRQMYKDRCMVG